MIEIIKLSKKYRKFLAVDDVSFNVRRGEIFALLGPNGSGKTTTMKAVVGLIIPTSGRIVVEGMDVQEYPREVRQLVSYLPQRVSFPGSLTVREVVRFYGGLRGLTKEIADEALDKLYFNGFSDKRVSELSGGMIQRLGLSIVSLPESPILVLDEPTANLDPQGVVRFRGFMKEFKSQGRTVLFSTHLLAEAEELADRVGIFVGGKIVAIESIEALRETFLKNRTIEEMYLHYVEARSHESS